MALTLACDDGVCKCVTVSRNILCKVHRFFLGAVLQVKSGVSLESDPVTGARCCAEPREGAKDTNWLEPCGVGGVDLSFYHLSIPHKMT